MLEATNTYVAVVAEKASYVSNIVAMIDMEVPAPSRRIRAARCAPTVLSSKRLFVPANRHAVARLENVIFSESRISIPPFFGMGGYLAQVVSAPRIVSRSLAWLAVNLVSGFSGLRFVKVGPRFVEPTLRAFLGRSRKVEISPTRHVVPLCYDTQYCSSNLAPMQGPF